MVLFYYQKTWALFHLELDTLRDATGSLLQMEKQLPWLFQFISKKNYVDQLEKYKKQNKNKQTKQKKNTQKNATFSSV